VVCEHAVCERNGFVRVGAMSTGAGGNSEVSPQKKVRIAKEKSTVSRDQSWCGVCQKYLFNAGTVAMHKQGKLHKANETRYAEHRAQAAREGVPALSDQQFYRQTLVDRIIHEVQWAVTDSTNTHSRETVDPPRIDALVNNFVDEVLQQRAADRSKSTHIEKEGVILFYKYVRLPNYQDVCRWQKRLCSALELTGKLRLAEEGINGTLAGLLSALEIYQHVMEHHAAFSGIDFKQSQGGRHTFSHLWIRPCTEIIMIGLDPDKITPDGGGKHLSPDEWHRALEPMSTGTLRDSDPQPFIMDCRNWYEADIGHFVGASKVPMRKFTEFPEVAKHIVRAEKLQNR